MDDLGVDLVAALDAVEIPGVGGLMAVADIGVSVVAQIAGVGAEEGAIGLVGAEGLVQLAAEFMARIAGEGLDGAAQIAGRGGAERAGAGGQVDAADIFGQDRAIDAQAVPFAVGSVAQRNAVQGVAQLLRVEAVDVERFVLLVGAPRIGGHEDHAGKGLDGLQRVHAGQLRLDFGAAEIDRGPGGLAVGHHDGVGVADVRRRFGVGQRRGRHGQADHRGGQVKRSLQRDIAK